MMRKEQLTCREAVESDVIRPDEMTCIGKERGDFQQRLRGTREGWERVSVSLPLAVASSSEKLVEKL